MTCTLLKHNVLISVNCQNQLLLSTKNSYLFLCCSYGGKGRNDASAITEYKENLDKMFKRFKEALPECLCIWNTNPPIAKDCKGGVFVPGTEDLKSIMGLHLLEANVYAQKLAVSYGFDVIDLYYYFLHHVHRRAEDGIHWDMTAHRRITNLILTHISEALEIDLPKHVENARKYSENKTAENQNKENKTDDNQDKENVTVQAEDDSNTTPTIVQKINKPNKQKKINGFGPAGRRIARGGAVLRRAMRFPRMRGQSQRLVPPRSNSPSFQNMNDGHMTSHQYHHGNQTDTVSYDYNHGYDDNYNENDNYEYHMGSNDYHAENEYDTNYNLYLYNHEEYLPPVEPPPRNRYAEDRYTSSIAENYYQSTQPPAHWQEDRWSPYGQYPHYGKAHPSQHGHIHRYVPYERRPPW